LANRIVRGRFAFVGGRVDANNDASKIGANLFLIYPKLETLDLSYFSLFA
jgi:hypothetical protein